MSLLKPLTLRHLCYLLNNILVFFTIVTQSFWRSLWSKTLNVTSLKSVKIDTLSMANTRFLSQFANIFLTYQTFGSNLHLLRVELPCKFPGKLRCTVWQGLNASYCFESDLSMYMMYVHACCNKLLRNCMIEREWAKIRGTVEHTVYITKSVIQAYRWSDSKRVLAFVL